MATPREQLKNGYDPALGIFRAEGAPEAYKWAVDRLVEEFGWEAVRIAIPTDYGRTKKVGIIFPDGIGFVIPITEVFLGDPVYDEDGDISHWNEVETFDLNDDPTLLDKYIENVKAQRDGRPS